MKWGVRRYQNKDGSLTSAGKKRYLDNPDLKRQQDELNAARVNKKKFDKEYSRALRKSSNVPTDKNLAETDQALEKLKDATTKYDKAKLKYDTNKEAARIQEKGITFDKKSKHRLKLEEQYKQMGMDDAQAQAAANNRIRTEKILAASAAITVTACAAYVANKKLGDRIDGVIKSGEHLARVEMQDTGGKLHDTFYVAKGKHDINRYKNLLGMTRQKQTGEAYLMKLKAGNDIKVASKDNATKIFKELYETDPTFRLSVKGHVDSHFSGKNRVGDINNLSNRNVKKMYENFNSALIDIREGNSGADKKFYNALKAKGYGAIQDINDMKFSGYNARNPLIVFDNAGGKNIMTESFSKITDDLSKKGNRELLKSAGEQVTKDFLKMAGPTSVAALTAKTVTTYKTDPSKKYKDQENFSRW